MEVHGTQVRVEFFCAHHPAFESKGKEGNKKAVQRRAAEQASAQAQPVRQQAAPNSAQRRSARRMEAFLAKKCELQQVAAAALNPLAPVFEVGKRRRLDAQSSPSAPESPRAEETRLILDLSDALVIRAQQRTDSAASQPPAHVESTEGHGKGGTRGRGGGDRNRGGRGAQR